MNFEAPASSTVSRWLLKHRRILAGLTGIVLVVAAGGLRFLERDPSVDAFVPGDHPAAAARDRAQELFGVEDPFLIGLLAEPGHSILEPEALKALQALAERAATLPNIEAHNLRSLATSEAISGTGGELLIDPIVDLELPSAEFGTTLTERLAWMPMLDGLLVNTDRTALLLVAPVEDANHAAETYQALQREAAAVRPPGFRWAIAGVSAMNARLDQTVTLDTRRLVPAAFVTALFLVWLAVRQWRLVMPALAVIAGATILAVGSLGWSGGKYYLITTALPVVVMAIAIADCLHITLQYLSLKPAGTAREDALSQALARTLKPVTLTSLTTAAGFLGLAWGSPMQPISEFGLFAAIGVLGAWLLSLTLLPAALLVVSPQIRQGATADSSQHSPWLVEQAFDHPRVALAGTLALLVILGAVGLKARFDYERSNYFRADDPVRLADAALREAFSGLAFLDVVISSSDEEPLLRTSRLQAIEQLKSWLEQQPLVVTVDSIADYVAVMADALGSDADLPRDLQELAPEQYFFAYEAGSEPGEFNNLIEPELSHLRLRARLRTDRFSSTAPLVSDLTEQVAQWSEIHELPAAVGGRVAVNEGWMTSLAESHLQSLGLALLLVTLTCACWFRRLRPTLLTLTPVLCGVLSVYALMGWLAIDIAPATAMTSAIATGLGVDFGIHLLNQLESRGIATRQDRLAPEFFVIARACVFSALALCCALLTICLSSAPPLRWFALLIAASALGSLFAALVIVPALARLLYHPPSLKPAAQPDYLETRS